MTSININKKVWTLIHRKTGLVISGHRGVVIAVELEQLMKK